MAASFRDGYEQVARQEGRRHRLGGAGNGLRRNALRRRLAAETFGMPLLLPLQREEAAFGAALLASVGAGIHPDLAAAGRLIRYTDAAGGEH
jgi:ribulose kinase